MFNCHILLCSHFDWANFWSAVTAIATALLVLVGYIQLGALNKTNKEVFLNNLKEAFFTEQARDLMLLIENDGLKFEVKTFSKTGEEQHEMGIFSNVLPREVRDYLDKEIGHSPKNTYTSQEVDDFLLQHFEDLGLYFVKGIINTYDADQAFGYYVVTTYECSAIQKYINWAKGDDSDIYSNFRTLYEKLPDSSKDTTTGKQ